MELVAAFIGAILGAVSSHLFQHRLWLRDARREAYLDAMAALDALEDAASSYSLSLRMLADIIEAGERDAIVEWGRRECREAYEEARSREIAVRRTRTAMELVGSPPTKFALQVIRVYTNLRPAHWEATVEEMRETVANMKDESVRANDARKSLVEYAKADLGIDQRISHRIRRIRQRIFRRWSRIRKRVTR